jgi:hypothetical protein
LTSEEERSARDHFVRGLGESTKHNSLAYGYSLALTGTFGLLAILDRTPHVLDILLFGIGGSVTFTIMNAAVTRGFTVRVAEEPPIVRALSTSLGVVSVSGALGVAALVAWGLEGWAGWLLGPFAASATYLLLSGAEFVLARAARAIRGVERLEEPE